MTSGPWLAACATACAALAAIAPVGASAAAPPKSFFGVQAWNSPSPAEFATMARGGIGTFRVNFTWAEVEPTRGLRNWEPVDADVTKAVRAGVGVLPVFLGSPKFAARRTSYPPRSSARGAYAAFVRDSVARYGNEGKFWKEHPELPYRPITKWQVWNEPSFAPYWNGRPVAAEYVSFLGLTSRAVKSRDAEARVVLGGLPDTTFRGKRNLVPYLKAIYARRGAKHFDAAAFNIYAAEPRDVLGVVRRVRRVMNQAGDRRTPIWITEFGWGSGGTPRNVLTRSQSGQASRLEQTFRLLISARRRYRIRMAAWFSWRDRARIDGEPNWWAIHTGLFDRSGKQKPAWRAYSAVLSDR